ncbi:hypothetical protein [Kitasatospora sp. NPDC002040]|uniref:hypothetical protein n=1 Tax=Kitasatospora sp. NPDC002040 TaxID=3154661 RepID=UPI003330AB71
MNENSTGTTEQPTLADAARRRLNSLTAPGGWLDQRRQDLIGGLDDFTTAEPWVRTLAYLLAITLAVVVLGTAGGVLLNAAGAVIDTVHLPQVLGATTGLRTALTGPVHVYLDAHTTNPLTPATAYAAWKTTGVVVFAVAFLGRVPVARLAWTAWSVATLAMIWQATPEAGRPVATGAAAAVLTAASFLALRGLSFSLRPMIINRTEIQPQQITIQVPEAKPATRHKPSGPFDQR